MEPMQGENKKFYHKKTATYFGRLGFVEDTTVKLVSSSETSFVLYKTHCVIRIMFCRIFTEVMLQSSISVMIIT